MTTDGGGWTALVNPLNVGLGVTHPNCQNRRLISLELEVVIQPIHSVLAMD